MAIGAELARARNAAGLTHAELAEKTRIRPAIIEAVERENFAACGGDVYVRGHVKAIALALGLDPKPLLAELGAGQTDTTFAQETADHLNIWELRERTDAPSERRSWALLVAIAVLIIGAFIYYARASSTNTDLVPSPESTPTATATPTAAATATVTPEATPTATASATPTVSAAASAEPTDAPLPTPPQETAATAATGAIVLQLDCVGSSWVRVTNDLGTLYEGTMRAGESKVLASDSSVRVRVGNAAGVQLTYNGKQYLNLGGAGEVYSHTFNV